MVADQIAEGQKPFMGIDPKLIPGWCGRFISKVRSNGFGQSQTGEKRSDFEFLHLLGLSGATEHGAREKERCDQPEDSPDTGQDNRASNGAHAED